MKIVMVGSEMAPYSRSGGLGEAIGGLSRALAGLGHQVTCVLPFHRCSWQVGRAKPTGMKLTVTIGQKQVTADIWEDKFVEASTHENPAPSVPSFTLGGGEHGKTGVGEGNDGAPRTEGQASNERLANEPTNDRAGKLRIIFVRRDEYFDRSELYSTLDRDYEDNAERFIFLSKVAVEWLRVCQLYPDVVHCHDWQTALVPLLLRLDEQSNKTSIATKTVFTIHNLAYQGIFWSLDFPMTNLPWQFFKPDGLEFYGQMNLMKAGIMFSDRLTTVSPRYAREIQTPEFGFGLESPLKTRADRLHGICNGIDPDEWNPARDPHIAQHYTPNNLEGKRRCKAELLSLFNLEGGEELPLIGMISRLTEQKGIDIIAEVLDQLVKDPVRLVVLGRGEARYERFWQDAAKRCRRSIGCRLAYDVSLAHKIEAGADMFLMPSKFEPCGLNQMYSLRYGTIPLVRATGGLDDTIEEFDPRTGQGTGFKFADYSGVALERKVKEALTVYANKTLWRQVQENAMTHRFSWSDAARQYLDIYQKD